MLTISVKHDFDRLAATLNDLARRQFPFAVAGALNDAADASARDINADISAGGIFAKATPFTRNAVVAPKSLRARKDKLVAVVTVRPIQAQYLLHEQIGGTRTPAENTRNPGAAALVLPGPALRLNAYRNIPAGKLAKLKAAAAAPAKHNSGVVFLAASAPGNKSGVGGYFQRGAGTLRRLTGFTASATYHPKFGFDARVIRTARRVFLASIGPRLAAAMASAKPR